MQAGCPLVGCVPWLKTGMLLPIYLDVCALCEDEFVFFFDLDGKPSSEKVTDLESSASLSRRGQGASQ